MNTQKEKNKKIIEQAIEAAKEGIKHDESTKGDGILIIHGEEAEGGVISELFVNGSHSTVARSLAGFADKSDAFFEILSAAYKIAITKKDPLLVAISSIIKGAVPGDVCPCEDCVAERAKNSTNVN